MSVLEASSHYAPHYCITLITVLDDLTAERRQGDSIHVIDSIWCRWNGWWCFRFFIRIHSAWKICWRRFDWLKQLLPLTQHCISKLNYFFFVSVLLFAPIFSITLPLFVWSIFFSAGIFRANRNPFITKHLNQTLSISLPPSLTASAVNEYTSNPIFVWIATTFGWPVCSTTNRHWIRLRTLQARLLTIKPNKRTIVSVEETQKQYLIRVCWLHPHHVIHHRRRPQNASLRAPWPSRPAKCQ